MGRGGDDLSFDLGFLSYLGPLCSPMSHRPEFRPLPHGHIVMFWDTVLL